jgi:hypothetical protein
MEEVERRFFETPISFSQLLHKYAYLIPITESNLQIQMSDVSALQCGQFIFMGSF